MLKAEYNLVMVNDVIASLALQAQGLSDDILAELDKAVRMPPSLSDDAFKSVYQRVLEIKATTGAEINKIIEEYFAKRELLIKQSREAKIKELTDQLAA